VTGVPAAARPSWHVARSCLSSTILPFSPTPAGASLRSRPLFFRGPPDGVRWHARRIWCTAKGAFCVCQTCHVSSEGEKFNVLPVSNTTSVSAKHERCSAVLFQERYIEKMAGGTRNMFFKCKNTSVVVTSPPTVTPVPAQEMVTILFAGLGAVCHGRGLRIQRAWQRR